MKLLIASDHAGFDLKEFLVAELTKLNFSIKNLGCHSALESVDYPDFAKKMCEQNKQDDVGILICGSGIGMSISANRFKKIRAALCLDEEMARLSRAHNDANVLCLGARFTDKSLALKITKIFLSTKFDGGRHIARINKI
jgi:ribose 5-phosphate isomerase B